MDLTTWSGIRQSVEQIVNLIANLFEQFSAKMLYPRILEVVALLGHCYEATQQVPQFKVFLKQCFQEGLGIQVLTALPERFYAVLEDTISYPDIMRRLKDRPSMRGLFTILSIRVKRVQGSLHDDMSYLLQVLPPLLNKETPYTCDHCGYAVSTLYWHCPSCRHWGTMKPYSGLKLKETQAA